MMNQLNVSAIQLSNLTYDSMIHGDIGMFYCFIVDMLIFEEEDAFGY